MFRVVSDIVSGDLPCVESAVIEQVCVEKSNEIGLIGWFWNIRHETDDTLRNYWVSPAHNVPFPQAEIASDDYAKVSPEDYLVFTESSVGTQVYEDEDEDEDDEDDEDDDDECILIEDIMAIINSSNECSETADDHTVVYSPPILSPSPVNAVTGGNPSKSPSPIAAMTEKKVEVVAAKSSPPRGHQVTAEKTIRKYVRVRGKVQIRLKRARFRYHRAHTQDERRTYRPQKTEDDK